MQSVAVASGTREDVVRAVLARGPVSAAALSRDLGITPAAVRRHLDALRAQGLVEARAGAPTRVRPGAAVERGRPARTYVATAAGHAAAVSAYDELAVAAVEQLRAEGGPAALTRFAQRRAVALEQRYGDTVAVAGPGPRERTGALAAALSADGYAASSTDVAGSVQLCQGHCPVHAVAARFPELCDAEAEAFSRLLGAPVRRLATLAAGSHACTTHVSALAPAAPGAPTTTSSTPHRTATPRGMDHA